jgi:hypothetical protein
VAPEKLGVAPSKNDGFSLTSGDFPSLGAEKDTSEKSTRPQDAGPHARPPSSSGRSVEGQGVDCTEGSYFQTYFSMFWGYTTDVGISFRELLMFIIISYERAMLPSQVFM